VIEVCQAIFRCLDEQSKSKTASHFNKASACL
jgi:hypothetical protein